MHCIAAGYNVLKMHTKNHPVLLKNTKKNKTIRSEFGRRTDLTNGLCGIRLDTDTRAPARLRRTEIRSETSTLFETMTTLLLLLFLCLERNVSNRLLMSVILHPPPHPPNVRGARARERKFAEVKKNN